MLVLVVGTALWPAGCADPPTPPLRVSTEHFRIHSDEMLCEGVGDWYEAAYDAWTDYLGVSLRDDEQVVIVHYSDIADVHCACNGPPATGCTDDHTIWARSSFNQHEFGHVMAARLGEPPRVLEEGLAVAFGCSQFLSGEVVDRPAEMSEWLVGDKFERTSREELFRRYVPAAAFVSYLISRHGRAAFLELYATLPHKPDRTTLDDAFVELFGADHETVVAQWLASPTQTLRDICYPLTECGAEPLGASVAQDVALACGPRSVVREGNVARSVRSLSADGGTSTLLRASSPKPFSLSLDACGLEMPELVLEVDAGRAAGFVAELPPATYRLWLASEDSTPSLVNVLREELPTSSTCDAGTAVAVDDDLDEVLFAIQGGATRWLQIVPASPRRLQLQFYVSASGDVEMSALTLCAEDCSFDSCVESLGDEGGVPIGGMVLEAGRPYHLGLVGSARVDVARLGLRFSSPTD